MAANAVNPIVYDFHTAWRDQVVQCHKGLDLPTWWCGIDPDLVPGDSGLPTDIKIVYPRDIGKQRLCYVSLTGH